MRCTIETRDFGTMVFTLYPEYAPLTVANFVKTARSGFYDGLCWCRIVRIMSFRAVRRTMTS